jgi:hypothetical protein
VVPDIISLRVVDNKEATEQRVPSGYVEVITSKVLRSPQGSVNVTEYMCHQWARICPVFRNRHPVLSSYKTGFVTRVTRRTVLVEQELITLQTTRIHTRFCCVLVVQLHVGRFLVPCCDGSYDFRVKRCSVRLCFIVWRAYLICVICIHLRILVSNTIPVSHGVCVV